VAGEGRSGGGAAEDEPAELPLELAAARVGVSVPTLYKRIRAGTLPARQEQGGRRRWIVRIDDLPAPGGAVGERPAPETTDLVVELLRQVDAAHTALRDAEGRAVRLEVENAGLRARLRDLQHVLRSLNAAMSDSVQALTMPDSLND